MLHNNVLSYYININLFYKVRILRCSICVDYVICAEKKKADYFPILYISLECIALLKDLPPLAVKCSPCSNKKYDFVLSAYFPRMKLFRPVAKSIEECVKSGISTSREKANFICTRKQSTRIAELRVPDEIIETLFSYMEQNLNIR